MKFELPDQGFETQETQLETNEEFLDFQDVEVTKVDDTKPWKPPLEVKITKADGEMVEGVDANIPAFTFKMGGQELTVSISAAGHIDCLHIKGEDLGSKFDYDSLKDLFEDAKDKLPKEIIEAEGPYAFSMEMGKNMGKEGLANLDELLEMGAVSEEDIEKLRSAKEEVFQLNESGTDEEKQVFVEKFSAGKIKFEVIRGGVLVPTIDLPKQSTTELFMVFGPDGEGGKTLYTAAPGRNMPRHPNPEQHKDAEGSINEETFKESAEAWLETLMLTGE